MGLWPKRSAERGALPLKAYTPPLGIACPFLHSRKRQDNVSTDGPPALGSARAVFCAFLEAARQASARGNNKKRGAGTV